MSRAWAVIWFTQRRKGQRAVDNLESLVLQKEVKDLYSIIGFPALPSLTLRRAGKDAKGKERLFSASTFSKLRVEFT
jgi:hypothetical protein